MYKIKQINVKDFMPRTISRETEFNYTNNNYKVTMTEAKEVRMSYYLRDIVIYKNNSVFQRGIIEDVTELNLYTQSKRFLFIPYIDNPIVYDLKMNRSFVLNITNVKFNQFDESEKFLVVGKWKKYQIVNLMKNELIYDSKDELSISGVFIGYGNTVWTINYENDKCILLMQSLSNLTIKSTLFPTPFEFFNIDIEKFRSLQEPVNYNLWIPTGGMLKSSYLNKWEFVSIGSDENRIIYKTVLPISVIGHKNINTPYCKVDYFYIEVEKIRNRISPLAAF